MFREVKPRTAEEWLNCPYEFRYIEYLLIDYSYTVNTMMI